MKKTLFAALALAFVASCSNEEVVEMAQKEAIGFDNAFINNSTRSVKQGYDNDNLFSDFSVFGFVGNTGVIFDGTLVSGSGIGANAKWAYTTTPQYWIPGAFYNFCAVAPTTNGGWTKTGCLVNNNAINTTLSFTNDGKTDLLYAESDRMEGLTVDNPKVAFTFRHLLSKVKFSFENAYDGTNATINVRGIKITNADHKANVSLTKETTTWSDYSDTLPLELGNATDDKTTEEVETTIPTYGYAKGGIFESNNEVLLIPSSSEKTYTIEFIVDLYVSNTFIATYEHTVNKNAAATVTFAPGAGFSYDIKAVITPDNINPNPDVTKEQILFTVSKFDEWTPAKDNTNVNI